jgi:hypothetical protein
MAELDDIKKQVQKEVGTTATEEAMFPGLNFSTFLLSLSTSALIALGELPDPIKNDSDINLLLAQQTITIIEILKEKTRGNLTPDEDRLIDSILYDLHIKYVRTAK